MALIYHMSPSFILESIRAFLSTKPLLAESISWAYKVPEDKETQIYDFYLLLTYAQILNNPKSLEPGLLKPGWDENTLEDLYAIVDDGLKQLVATMREDYLKAGAVAMASELRHVFFSGAINKYGLQDVLTEEEYQPFMRFLIDNDKYKYIASDQSMQRNKDKEWIGIGRKKEYSAAYKSFLKSKMSVDTLCDIGQKLFPLDIWAPKYGGKDWVDIAKEIRNLYRAKGTMPTALALDRVIDLEHNTGLMVDKSAAFAKDGSHSWMKRTLNYKKDATPWKLAEFSSLPEKVVGMLNRLTGLSGTKEDDTKAPEASIEKLAGNIEKKLKGGGSVAKTKTPETTKPHHFHENGGGLVENTATVDKTAYVAKTARVLDHAKVLEYAILEGEAIVEGFAVVSDHAKITNALISGNAEVSGTAKVSDHAKVHGSAKILHEAQVFDNAYVCENAMVFGRASVGGISSISGYAKVYEDAKIFEYPMVKGMASILGDAKVSGYSQILDHAIVQGSAKIKGHATVRDRAIVEGKAVIEDFAVISGEAVVDYNVHGNTLVTNKEGKT